MKRLSLMMFCCLSFGMAAGADGGEGPAGEAGTGLAEPWACREAAALARQFAAETALASWRENEPCRRREAAACLAAVQEKMLAAAGTAGRAAVSDETLARLSRLDAALRGELADNEGYQTRRKEIQAMLAKPETPPFLYKVGVDGFLRGEGVAAFRLTDFSYRPDHGEGRFLYRVKPYLYWHPTDFLDLHLEGQGYGYSGGNQYYGKYSLYQGFIEGRCPRFEGLSVKVGRQELVYGSAFMLGSDSFYDGLSYDAVRVRLTPVGPLTVDLFGGWYAPPFADGMAGNLAGGYASWAFGEETALEAYTFRDTGSADHQVGEYRTSWGLRGTMALGPVELEVEPVWQTGRLYNADLGGNESIRAWGGHADLTVEATLADRRTSLFIGAAYGSGSRDAAAGASARQEFSNPATDTSLTGDMNVVGSLAGLDVGDYHASGLQVYTLGWGVDLLSAVNFSATGRYFLANYVPEGASRRLGLETDFTLTWTASDELALIVGYDRFFTGGFFHAATGSDSDIHYGYAMLQFNLAHQRPKRPAVR
ncbi:outer membrane channel protein [Geotalea uraniireducens]|uniref:Outer membrane channel protein n=1 Tax=Geotalea uraniireducens TaxID=351604 RepID=A0ABM8EIU5_9BACT|nr:alginate export family protein [Geotalea uraniireducens]BDV42382.1 outer membrane channel protein [Geotalea uraniireducens]